MSGSSSVTTPSATRKHTTRRSTSWETRLASTRVPRSLHIHVPRSSISHDDARLDNPAYAALSGAHSRFALRSGRALRYAPDIAPFLALPSKVSRTDWQDAIELVPPGTMAATVHDGSPLPELVKVTQTFELVQMIGERASGAPDPEALTLGPADVPEMLELVRLTEPGPFFQRTIELGRYIGVRRDGALVAMAGERLHFDGWTEISAVCTAPTHRGHGVASRLVATLVADIHHRSEHVFLHVLTDNTSAIRLYEELGFRARSARTISVLTRAG
jgi:ribosomal protein S18 acetylase RimI-like enzyme